MKREEMWGERGNGGRQIDISACFGGGRGEMRGRVSRMVRVNIGEGEFLVPTPVSTRCKC
jgi:hypothetical protein